MKKLFTVFLSLVLILSVFGYSTADTQNWAGTWYRNIFKNNANLKIFNITDSTFDFELRAFSGGHLSGVKGTADIIGNNKAVFKKSDQIHDDIYIFELKNEGIAVVYNYKKEPSYNNVFPEGIYGRTPPEDNYSNMFTEYKILTLEQENIFKNLTDEYYKTFETNLQLKIQEDDLDNFGAEVTQTAVRGLFTICESIIMIRNSDNAIWAATIKDNEVYYFTNTNIPYIPKTILKWQERFREKPIIWIK